MGELMTTHTVPVRPDGWPDRLGRRPMTSDDRAKIRKALEAGLPEGPPTKCGPFLSPSTALSTAIHASSSRCATASTPPPAPLRKDARPPTTPRHATNTTIGIRGPDAADRINQFRHALAKLITKHGWTPRDEPR